MVDVTHYSSPCFDALEDSCLFEDCLSFARKGVAEEPPDSAVQCMEVIRESSVTINRCQAITDGLLKALVSDGALLLLRPAEQLVCCGDTGEEVSLCLAFP